MNKVTGLVVRFFGLPASAVREPLCHWLHAFGPSTARYLTMAAKWEGFGTSLIIQTRPKGAVARFFLQMKDTANWSEPWPVIKAKFESGQYTGYKLVEFDPAFDKEKRLTAIAILIEHLCKGRAT